MWDFDPNLSLEELYHEELYELEQMIRNGASSRQIARRQFQFLGQSDIMKTYRKFGKEPGEEEESYW